MDESLNTLRLRDVIEADLPIFYAQQLDPEACAMAAFPSRERADFMAHWQQIMADSDIILQTILLDGQIAGNIVCFPQDGKREVGYWLGRDYWGRGLATRALALFLDQIETRPLFAHVAKHNIASRRVLEKCGFRINAEDRFLGAPDQIIEEFILMLDA